MIDDDRIRWRIGGNSTLVPATAKRTAQRVMTWHLQMIAERDYRGAKEPRWINACRVSPRLAGAVERNIEGVNLARVVATYKRAPFGGALVNQQRVPRKLMQLDDVRRAA